MIFNNLGLPAGEDDDHRIFAVLAYLNPDRQCRRSSVSVIARRATVFLLQLGLRGTMPTGVASGTPSRHRPCN
jgi:hypothetical protein